MNQQELMEMLEEGIDRLRAAQATILEEVPFNGTVPDEILANIKIDVQPLYQLTETDVR